MSVLISIIVPVFNCGDTIENCINSLTGQTLENIEIICSDDGSQDSSLSIINDLAGKDSRIKVISAERNMGTLMARKKAVELASGEYIMFCDGDDWYEPNACEELYASAREKDLDVLMYEVKAVNSETEENYARHKWMQNGFRVKEECIRHEHAIPQINRINGLNNKIIRADVCRKAYSCTKNIYMTNAEDTYACWLIHFFSDSFETINKTYYNYDYTKGGTGINSRTLEQFERFASCMSTYETLTRQFLIDNCASDDIMNRFEEDAEIKRTFCIKEWRRTICNEDAAEALEILMKYFTKEEVLRILHSRLNYVEQTRDHIVLKNDRSEETLKKAKTALETAEENIEKLKKTNEELRNELAQTGDELVKTGDELVKTED